MAEVAKALGDPIRLQLVDVLRKHAGKVCVCELVPLFDIGQPTLSHHLKKLRDAGIVDSERRASGRTTTSSRRRSNRCRPGSHADHPTYRDQEPGMPEQVQTSDDIREVVRERYAKAAREVAAAPDQAGCGCGPSDGSSCCGSDTAGERRCRRRRLRLGPVRRRRGRAGPGSRAHCIARLRRADGRRRPARGRDGARSRLGRRRGCPDQRPARRTYRQGDRTRHDGRDARPRPRATPRRPASRTSSSSRATSRPCRSPDASVDVVISNCVINLSADKAAVLREAARVLRPGGRFAVSDVIADDNMDEATRADMAQWTGCIAGALTRAEFERARERRRAREHRDHRDAPCPRARGLGHHPSAQALRTTRPRRAARPGATRR